MSHQVIKKCNYTEGIGKKKTVHLGSCVIRHDTVNWLGHRTFSSLTALNLHLYHIHEEISESTINSLALDPLG